MKSCNKICFKNYSLSGRWITFHTNHFYPGDLLCVNLSSWIQQRRKWGNLITPEYLLLKNHPSLLEFFIPYWKSPKLWTIKSHGKCQKSTECILGFNTSTVVSITPPDSTPSWQPYYTHLLLYLLLWLRIHCFKLNFRTVVQLNILNFEKFILDPF